MKLYSFRKKLAISIPIFFGVGFVALITLLVVNQPPSWRSSLDKYITAIENGSAKDIQIVRVEKAKQPWAFDPNMSIIAFGDSVHYQTTWFHQEPQSPVLIESDSSTPELVSGGRQPLPFPPDAAWCAHLRSKDTAGQTRSEWTVVIARHSDLYNADYAIHEISNALDTTTTQLTLIKIGCTNIQ